MTFGFTFGTIWTSSKIIDYLSKKDDGKLHVDTALKQKISKSKFQIGNISMFCAAILQKPADRQFMLDCMIERFEADVKKRGRKYALSIWWWDIGSNLIPAIKRFAKWLFWGVIIEKLIPK